jgi:hypothetical protein
MGALIYSILFAAFGVILPTKPNATGMPLILNTQR